MTGSGMNGLNTDCISSWLELESDPGLFTLLVDDFGVRGIQVEEVYDLSKPLDNSTFGFIFLFKWIEMRNGRRGKTSGPDSNSNYVTDPNIINNMFFAHQIVPNSCATHALLSILLNSKTNNTFQLGELLNNFKNLCKGLSPEMKGFAIGNQPRLAQAHNSFAKPESDTKKISSQTPTLLSSSNTVTNMSSSNLATSNGPPQIQFSNEIFHFICFVPINGKLYELDGLKPYPIDHGRIEATSCNPKLIEQLLETDNLELRSTLFYLHENYRTGSFNWSDKFRQIIEQRLSSHGQQNHDIRFNLMAVVADKMIKFKKELNILESNRNLFLNILNQYNNEKYHNKENLFKFYIDLKSNDLVNSLIENVNKNEDIVSELFVENLCRLVERFDLIDTSKIFQICPIKNEKCEIFASKSAVLKEVRDIETALGTEIESIQAKYSEEIDKRKKYTIDAFRRKHVYNEFIISYLRALTENGKLEEIVRNSVTNKCGTGNQTDNKTAASSFFISPNSLFIQQNSIKKSRKK